MTPIKINQICLPCLFTNTNQHHKMCLILNHWLYYFPGWENPVLMIYLIGLQGGILQLMQSFDFMKRSLHLAGGKAGLILSWALASDKLDLL